MKRGVDGSEAKIHRADTIPPPDGEADPYSAPTKVGPLARAAMRAMMMTEERPLESGALAGTLPSPYAELDESEHLDPHVLFDDAGPCRQSGKTQLLQLVLPIQPTSGTRPAQSAIPPRLPDPISVRTPELRRPRRSTTWFEMVLVFLCVMAIAVPCGWFLLVR